jgi:hypothetical protein
MPHDKKPTESSSDSQASIVKYITSHALERWMQRDRCTSERQAHATIKKQFALATEVELAPAYKTIALLNHGFKPARYFKYDKWVFVVSDEGSLITIHSGTAKRWIPLGSTPPPRKKRNKRRPR